MNVLDSAFAFALECHGEQTRPNGEPYVEHLLEVTEILGQKLFITDEKMLVAGILHDVVEDTPCSLGDIELRFGTEVANLVRWLTYQKQADRKKARKDYFTQLQQAPSDAIVIKLADRLSNVQRLDTHPSREKQKKYYHETVEKIIPLAYHYPWFALQFELWQEKFEKMYKENVFKKLIAEFQRIINGLL